MFDDQADRLWLSLALLAALTAAPGLSAGGVPLLPLFLALAGLACAGHRPSRAFVLEKTGVAFGGSALRAVAVLAGALLMIQLMPLELALLMAGDVLAYVEVVVAVSLIAGHARLPLVKTRLRRGVEAAVRFWRRPGTRRRRSARPPRQPASPAGDEDGEAAPWSAAFA
ncbi:hypothetical protein [Brevundimonas sp. 2YAF1]|uniref:hypothetical protein n=1 Tax=Brevundimonas sp. 2YAF1 TaxID=3233024 RepID=UPI003F928AB6